MSTAQIALSSRLNNHELNKLVEKMTELLKLSAIQAINSQINSNVYKFKPGVIKVGKKKSVSYPSVASVVAERFNKKDPAVRRVIRMDLGNDISGTRAIHDWGVDMRSSRSIIEQIDVKKHFAFINGTAFSEAAVNRMVSEMSVFTRPSVPESLKEVPSNKKIRFRVHEVKCVDETNPEWWGSDEIAYGGTAIDDKGVSTKIPEYYVGGGFDDGNVKTYSPPKIVKTFILNDTTYPKTFTVVLALAEKDEGGLSDFIQQLWDAIKGEIQKILGALGAAAGAYIGAEIGGSIGTTIAGPLGTVIGAVAGAIIGALVGWLISALKDDIFPPQETEAILVSKYDTFNGGSLVSQPTFLDYQGHGGHYTVKFDWEIVR